MVACPVCETPDGSLALKRKGRVSKESYWPPGNLPGEICEFCMFKISYEEQEEKELFGAAKLVDQKGNLIAYIAIEKKGQMVKFPDGKEIEFKDRMIIEGISSDDGCQIMRVVDPEEQNNGNNNNSKLQSKEQSAEEAQDPESS